MALNGFISRRRWTESPMNGFDLSSSIDCEQAHVLAVDDSFVDRKVIERLLKISSYKVTAVDSGHRALQYLGLDEERNSDVVDGLKVDLIITDYCMPGMTGYELLKKIKESSAFRQTPVVIMSSENVITRIDRCLEEGAEDFIVKPVKLADVKRLKGYMMMKADRLKDRMEMDMMAGGGLVGAAIGINKSKSRDDDGPQFSPLVVSQSPELLLQQQPLATSPSPLSRTDVSVSHQSQQSSDSDDSLPLSQSSVSLDSMTSDSPPQSSDSPFSENLQQTSLSTATSSSSSYSLLLEDESPPCFPTPPTPTIMSLSPSVQVLDSPTIKIKLTTISDDQEIVPDSNKLLC